MKPVLKIRVFPRGMFFPGCAFFAILAFFSWNGEFSTPVLAQEPTVHRDISYISREIFETADEYQRKQCVLDVYVPRNTEESSEKRAVVFWLHGGGLTGGSKDIPPFLKKEPFVLVSVEYRLSPKVGYPAFLEDAAAALAWTFGNIETYGGDPESVFVGGYSAGGYLAAMISMDPRWMQAHEIRTDRIAGILLGSAQVSTHFHVKKLRNIPGPQYLPVIDESAPMHYLDKDLPPILMVLGDRKIEWKVRVEENEMMYASLRALGHPHVEFYENRGYDHGTLGNTHGDFAPEAAAQILQFIQKVLERRKPNGVQARSVSKGNAGNPFPIPQHLFRHSREGGNL